MTQDAADLPRVAELHRTAMDLADQAAAAKRAGDEASFMDRTREALEKETLAADLVAEWLDLEPTRSVLHRSAATLAFECGEARRAEQLVGRALAGQPPLEIASELRDLLETIAFHRHLVVRGVALQRGELQMSLAGLSVASGLTRSDMFVTRVKDFETLVYRTAERRLGKPFREAGRRIKKLAEELQLYISVPREGSFAVTFRIGQSMQLPLPFPGADFAGELIDDLLDGLELVNGGNLDRLSEHIRDESYFRNFVGLARSIAPDGEDVRLVGFTAPAARGERLVAMSRARTDIPTSASVSASAVAVLSSGTVDDTAATIVEVRGVLLEADATSRKEGRICVVANGREQSIRVPRGMMSDVVRPWFEEEVVVRARRDGNAFVLETIDGAT